MPKMEKVYLHNPSSEQISLISISATTAHFHASFFQNRVSTHHLKNVSLRQASLSWQIYNLCIMNWLVTTYDLVFCHIFLCWSHHVIWLPCFKRCALMNGFGCRDPWTTSKEGWSEKVNSNIMKLWCCCCVGIWHMPLAAVYLKTLKTYFNLTGLSVSRLK